MIYLGIETSCDETAAGVVRNGREVLSNVVSSQDGIHLPFGGVVPELASRQHAAVISQVVQSALSKAGVAIGDISAVAVTQSPGLVGALLVGISFGKALAYSHRIPLVGVNHLEGHIAGVYLEEGDPVFPAAVLVVSGGHTNLYHVSPESSPRLIGQTLDDAAGEAFDKGAKMLGLPFPGGPGIDRVAREGERERVHFPRPAMKGMGLNMSFSGLKTALRYYLDRTDFPFGMEAELPHIAAAYQEAIVDVLVGKSISAAEQIGAKSIWMTGGVAANSRLRQRMVQACGERDLILSIPRPGYCTDNGAMVAAAGFFSSPDSGILDLSLSPRTSPKAGRYKTTGISR